MNTSRAFALAVAAFAAYNGAAILWEQGKPNSTQCAKCAYTRIAVGAGVAVAGLVLAFGGTRPAGGCA